MFNILPVSDSYDDGEFQLRIKIADFSFSAFSKTKQIQFIYILFLSVRLSVQVHLIYPELLV